MEDKIVMAIKVILKRTFLLIKVVYFGQCISDFYIFYLLKNIT